MRVGFILAALVLSSSATRLLKGCDKSDKYCDTNEYDTEFAVEAKRGGYDVTPVDNFAKKEAAALPTQLDGEALTKEIGAKGLNSELNGAADGAGIKDKSDLADLLESIKGAEVFINRTPKEQL